jgi:4-hydroxy-2-oxoheptanedioate aldolase
VTKLRETLAAGKSALALWGTSSDPIVAEVLGRLGYDCVILDNQHGGVTWHNMAQLIQALELGGTPALVRPTANDPTLINRALDFGAAGVVVPMVSTAAQAQQAASGCRYPPKGVRSFGPLRNYYGIEYLNSKPLCIVMIETAEALDNLDAIAAVPEVDGLLIGPADLAISMGIGFSMEMSPQVWNAVDRVVAACKKNGKFSASASLGLANAKQLIEHGIQLVGQGSDVYHIRRGAAAEIEEYKSWSK